MSQKVAVRKVWFSQESLSKLWVEYVRVETALTGEPLYRCIDRLIEATGEGRVCQIRLLKIAHLLIAAGILPRVSKV